MQDNFLTVGVCLVTGSHNKIIENQVGMVRYSVEDKAFLFTLSSHPDEEYLGDYRVNPNSLSLVENKEKELMDAGGKLVIIRPQGYGS